MSNPQDIIGVVKDWRHSACGGSRPMDCKKCEAVLENFASISEALLIAVEALKTYSQEMPGGICDAADEALCRISSLPVR